MTTPTLTYVPDSANYVISGRAPDSSVEVAIPGGLPATRLDKAFSVSQITVTWSVSLANGNYAALSTFWKTTCAFGTLPFNASLVLDGVLATYLCKFVKGSFGLQSASGDTYVVGANLWVQEQ